MNAGGHSMTLAASAQRIWRTHEADKIERRNPVGMEHTEYRRCRAVASTTAAATFRAEIGPIGAHGANGYRQRDRSFALPQGRARQSNENSAILTVHPNRAA